MKDSMHSKGTYYFVLSAFDRKIFDPVNPMSIAYRR